ncbi:MAG: twin-arginine translocation signal domain-containing protein, partial [Acidimicrobiia bacterium]|nr:twin-arginine translocation signal domain-containing protein [Acidimicrobiia bacterium]
MKHARAVDAECVLTTRRRFLATLGAGAAVAVGGTWGMSVWSRDPAFAGLTLPAATYGIDTPNRTLVVIEMGGGNDGLNMVVPYADNRYHDLRGDLAISDPLPLDDHVGLHPALTNIAMKYSAGDVAIVEGVGYESPDLSHFSSMSTWWSGQQGSAGRTGWLGRYLDAAVGGDEPLAAVTIGPGPSPALLGERSFQVAIQDVSGLSPNVPP